MYAAVRRYKTKPGKAQEIARRAQAEFVPIVEKLPGYVSYYGIIGDGNSMVTVSMFNDKAGEEASTRKAAEWIRSAGLGDLVDGPPEVIAGSVAWKGK